MDSEVVTKWKREVATSYQPKDDELKIVYEKRLKDFKKEKRWKGAQLHINYLVHS